MKWIFVNEMNFNEGNERNEFSINFKHFQRVFIWLWPTDGQTDRTSYRGAMAHLGIILAYFWIISSDFCFFSRFSTRAWPTDQPTDQPTDRASYRGAMAHLKTAQKKSKRNQRVVNGKNRHETLVDWTVHSKIWKTVTLYLLILNSCRPTAGPIELDMTLK